MPRKSKGGGRGGARQGAPGVAYAQRSDLNAPKTQPIRVAPAGTYGEATQQANAQRSLPLPGPGAGIPAPAAGPGTGAPQAPQSPLPGQLGPLTAPTQNPTQPLTAGLPTGPGPGPEALQPAGTLTPIDEVRAIFAAHPSDDMRKLLAYLDGY